MNNPFEGLHGAEALSSEPDRAWPELREVIKKMHDKGDGNGIAAQLETLDESSRETLESVFNLYGARLNSLCFVDDMDVPGLKEKLALLQSEQDVKKKKEVVLQIKKIIGE